MGARIVDKGDTLNATLYVNGKAVGHTEGMINYTIPNPGIFNITFRTSGDAYYGGASVSNKYVDFPYGVVVPPLFAVVMCGLHSHWWRASRG